MLFAIPMSESSEEIIDTYFQAFENYVTSARLTFRSVRSRLEELEKENGRPVGPGENPQSRKPPSDDAKKLKRDIEAMQAAFDDGSVYKEALEATNMVLPGYQLKYFRELPATEIYDHFVECYTHKFVTQNTDQERHTCRYYEGMLERSKTKRIEDLDPVFAAMQIVVSQRYLENSALIEADGLAEALECMPVRHPEITAEALLEKRNGYSRLAGDEASSAWMALLEDFAKSYTDYGIAEWRNARTDAFGCYKNLLEHESLKPPPVDSDTPQNKAQRKWDAEAKCLQDLYKQAYLKFEKIDDARSEVGGAEMKSKALDDAEERLYSMYPELHRAVVNHMKDAWQKINDERIARNESREGTEKENLPSSKLQR